MRETSGKEGRELSWWKPHGLLEGCCSVLVKKTDPGLPKIQMIPRLIMVSLKTVSTLQQ
jgi:hypothetical protein